MAKTNLTIQLDTDVIERAKILAARRGTSVSGLVAKQLGELVASDARYEAARARAIALLAGPAARGGRTWSRDELYEERLGRYGRRR